MVINVGFGVVRDIYTRELRIGLSTHCITLPGVVFWDDDNTPSAD